MIDNMKLIVGLGNPGQKYLMTRHNIGFLCINALARAYSSPPFKNNFKAQFTKIMIQGEPVLLCKPQTFMNLSGESVQLIVNFYNIELDNMLVIHDDIDTPFGRFKFQKNRGHGGNNGIKSIHKHLGTNEYARIKAGIDRPPNPKQDVANYVLQSFADDEQETLSDMLNNIVDATEEFVLNGLQSAANKYNNKN